MRYARPRRCQCGITEQFMPDERNGSQKGDSACQPSDGLPGAGMTHYYGGSECEPGNRLTDKIDRAK